MCVCVRACVYLAIKEKNEGIKIQAKHLPFLFFKRCETFAESKSKKKKSLNKDNASHSVNINKV